jgi:hypothetical protein
MSKTINSILTGVTWYRGRYVWYATARYGGKVISRRGDSRDQALAKLEVALNKVSDHPVYLFNF